MDIKKFLLDKNTEENKNITDHESVIQQVENFCAECLEGVYYIDTAKRSRYAKVAFYLGVVADIYNYINESEKGKDYISLLMTQNNRRPAFIVIQFEIKLKK
ncbi:MAG: hypothetical protein FWG69_01760 [Oscillospiraceae bacterium]|nr:hypothetical protein [Oscillospiraceae bacterium]